MDPPVAQRDGNEEPEPLSRKIFLRHDLNNHNIIQSLDLNENAKIAKK